MFVRDYNKENVNLKMEPKIQQPEKSTIKATKVQFVSKFIKQSKFEEFSSGMFWFYVLSFIVPALYALRLLDLMMMLINRINGKYDFSTA